MNSARNRIRPAACYCSLGRREISPKPKSARGPLLAKSIRFPGRQTARSRETAHRPARARRVPRSKPQPGPGPGKLQPAWAESRSGVCEPFISIRRSRAVFGRTKPASTPVARTLAHFVPLSLARAPHRRLRAPERRRRERAGGAARGPRRRAR